jgi:inorganic pyrophosphatase
MNYKNIKNLIGSEVKVKIDRPLGSKHPEYDYIYPVNYGFIEGIKAPDGDDLDAYVLGINVPLKEFEGVCIAIIKRDDDEDDKLIVVPKGKDFSDKEIISLIKFQEKFFKSIVCRS